jgi:hypothetical protein
VFQACLFLLFAMALRADAAERVEIRFNVPPGLEEYSGLQPVTFGVPFERGVLEIDQGLRVVNAARERVPGLFEVTAIYGPDARRIERWAFVTDNGNTNPRSKQGVSFQVPSEGPAGVYAVVVRTIAPVGAQASSGKVVHYMPPGRRAFCSAVWGGQAWFEPTEHACPDLDQLLFNAGSD